MTYCLDCQGELLQCCEVDACCNCIHSSAKRTLESDLANKKGPFRLLVSQPSDALTSPPPIGVSEMCDDMAKAYRDSLDEPVRTGGSTSPQDDLSALRYTVTAGDTLPPPNGYREVSIGGVSRLVPMLKLVRGGK